MWLVAYEMASLLRALLSGGGGEATANGGAAAAGAADGAEHSNQGAEGEEEEEEEELGDFLCWADKAIHLRLGEWHMPTVSHKRNDILCRRGTCAETRSNGGSDRFAVRLDGRERGSKQVRQEGLH